jgi:HlyD family secretion protein
VVILAAGLAGLAWWLLQPPKLPAGFTSSNGRIEATEVDIAAKLAERIKDELVDEGDFVTAGQEVAHMSTDVLEAQRREAVGRLGVAKAAVETAQATRRQRESEKDAAVAVVAQREAELDLANYLYDRARRLGTTNLSPDEYDTRRSAFFAAKANLSTAKANVAAAEAAIATAKAAIIAAQEAVASSEATIQRIDADIKDSTLITPRTGRVQYRISQPGEVLPAGGKVMNLIDLSDVYMTFFLPDAEAGQVHMGTEVRLVLDAYPQYVIPARVTFVADVAQFTPKTVETKVERQKLTFRIKAHIPQELLKKYLRDVKTGLPGVAYVQLDPNAEWPARLQERLPSP